MSTTEWKFVPVESDENMATAFFDRVTVTSRGGLIGVRSALNAAIAAAPVPPSVESLLENWTPSDQQAFAKFRDEHFPGEMSSYAIQSLGSAWKDGQANAAQPAAHLTIPGALEWDGDNGTHGVVGTHGGDGEHSESAAAIATLKALGYTHNGGTHWKPPVGQKPDFDLIDSLRSQLANTEQSRRSFFDLSQDLEKRLAERDALLRESSEWIKANSFGGCDAVDLWERIDAIASAKCETCGDWGHIETEDSAHDCPECGPSVIERAVEAGVMNAPAKPKTCIECDQPYCHGVCVERGDQDYDRDQAARGGD